LTNPPFRRKVSSPTNPSFPTVRNKFALHPLGSFSTRAFVFSIPLLLFPPFPSILCPLSRRTCCHFSFLVGVGSNCIFSNSTTLFPIPFTTFFRNKTVVTTVFQPLFSIYGGELSFTVLVGFLIFFPSSSEDPPFFFGPTSHTLFSRGRTTFPFNDLSHDFSSPCLRRKGGLFPSAKHLPPPLTPLFLRFCDSITTFRYSGSLKAPFPGYNFTVFLFFFSAPPFFLASTLFSSSILIESSCF